MVLNCGIKTAERVEGVLRVWGHMWKFAVIVKLYCAKFNVNIITKVSAIREFTVYVIANKLLIVHFHHRATHFKCSGAAVCVAVDHRENCSTIFPDVHSKYFQLQAIHYRLHSDFIYNMESKSFFPSTYKIWIHSKLC